MAPFKVNLRVERKDNKCTPTRVDLQHQTWRPDEVLRKMYFNFIQILKIASLPEL